ncbi:MAG: hypothetical protein Q8P18_21450 [Pseudomonadota bacterium]|nr:hypothetical protein [Pseudomonadota bacterium]
MWTLVHVELENKVSSAKRAIFDEEMAARKWQKLPDPYTTWIASWKDGITASQANRQTELDVASAAETAGISVYEAVMHVGPGKPTRFSNQ